MSKQFTIAELSKVGTLRFPTCRISLKLWRFSMPHVVVKLYSGRSELQKTALAREITKAVTASLGNVEDFVTVGIEDVDQSQWVEDVFKPEILGKKTTIYKKPGYDPLNS
jgi:4-oxalocrotonate tautomerase